MMISGMIWVGDSVNFLTIFYFRLKILWRMSDSEFSDAESGGGESEVGQMDKIFFLDFSPYLAGTKSDKPLPPE